MLKTILAAASVATVLSTVGCSAPADSPAPSSDEALSASGTLSLAEATKQVAAIRSKYDPTGDNALLLDPSLAQPYLDEVKLIFPKIARTDVITLGGTAFTYVSTPIATGAVLDLGIFDTAVADYADLWEFSSLWGGLAAENPEFWTKLNLVIGHATTGTLSDLQLLELVTITNTSGAGILAGLQAVDWSSAPDATAAQANSLIAAEGAYTTLDTTLFGQVDETEQRGPAGGQATFDIDTSNTFAVEVFTRSYSKLRLFTEASSGGTTVDLGGHLASVYAYTGKPAKNGIALAKSSLTASEMKEINEYVVNE